MGSNARALVLAALVYAVTRDPMATLATGAGSLVLDMVG